MTIIKVVIKLIIEIIRIIIIIIHTFTIVILLVVVTALLLSLHIVTNTVFSVGGTINSKLIISYMRSVSFQNPPRERERPTQAPSW